MLSSFITQLRHVEDSPMKTFGEIYKLRNLKRANMFSKPRQSYITDLILANKPLSFESTYMIETELSDFHMSLMYKDSF